MMKYIIKKFAQYFKNETFEVNEDLSNLSSVLNRHLTSYKDEVGDLNIQVKKINDEFVKLKEMFLDMNSSITDKETELTKYRKGYEKVISKNYASNILDLYELLEMLEPEEVEQKLDSLKQFAREVLTDLHIEKIQPLINKDFRDQVGVDADSEFSSTDDETKTGFVSEVISVGYKIQFDDKTSEILRPAIAKVYKYENHQI